MSNFTRTAIKRPPKDTPIEWIAPEGTLISGKWAGGAVWFPENSNMHIYYTPEFWRLAEQTAERKP